MQARGTYPYRCGNCIKAPTPIGVETVSRHLPLQVWKLYQGTSLGHDTRDTEKQGALPRTACAVFVNGAEIPRGTDANEGKTTLPQKKHVQKDVVAVQNVPVQGATVQGEWHPAQSNFIIVVLLAPTVIAH